MKSLWAVLQWGDSSESEWRDRYEAAARAARHFVYDWDIAADVVIYGGEVEELTGYGLDDLSGGIERWLNILHPDDRDAFRAEVASLREGGTSFALEFRILCRDGEAVWCEGRGHVIGAGEAARLVGVVTEATERFKALARLQEIAESGEVALWSWTLATGLVEADARTRSIWGFAETAPLRIDDFRARIHPGDADRVVAALDAIVAAGGEFDLEFRVRSPGGARWLTARGRGGSRLHGPGTVMGIFLDITGRKEAEQALARSEARLRLAQSIAGLGIFDWEAGADHAVISDGYATILGLPDGQTTLGVEEWLAGVHPDDRARVRADLNAALADGTGYEAQYRILRRSDGAVRILASKAEVVREADGRPRRVVGAVDDITQARRDEEAKDLLSRELSHRIKNLFAVAAALATLTARTATSPKDMAEDLRRRLLALGRAHDLVRPRLGPQGADAEASLGALLRALLEPYEDTRSPQARVVVDTDDVVVGPNAATALALVVHELATNAAKYGALSAPDGRVEIACRNQDDAVAIVWRERGGPVVMAPEGDQGFGTLLARQSITHQLGGAIETEWDPAGVTVTLRIPRDRLKG